MGFTADLVLSFIRRKKCIPHDYPRTKWFYAYSQCLILRYLSLTIIDGLQRLSRVIVRNPVLCISEKFWCRSAAHPHRPLIKILQFYGVALKRTIFLLKNCVVFHISSQNTDYGYSLEPIFSIRYKTSV